MLLSVISLHRVLPLTLGAISINCLCLDAQLALDKKFFVDRIIHVWSTLPSTVNFTSLCFRNSIEMIDFFLVFFFVCNVLLV